MRRKIYLGVFIVFAGIAGTLYYSQTRLSPAVVATRNLMIGTRIQDSDITVRSVNPTSLSDELIGSPEQAVGKVVTYPVLQGQLLDARQLATSKNAASLLTGLPVPPGYRIIGLPIVPASAVGGVLKAGDLVDVMAVANPSKSIALGDGPALTPVVLGRDVLVVGLRTDQGTSLDDGDSAMNGGNNKPGSVLLAVPESEETTYSAATAGSTFVLALSTD
jgi:Flp pilus assembly protein CpaB